MFAYYLKLSVLSLRSTPILSALIIIAIGLGIGLSMTTLTVYHMLSADPLPSKSEQLFAVQLESYGPGIDFATDDGLHKQITYQDAMNLHKSPIPKRQTRLLRSGSTIQDKMGESAAFLDIVRYCDSDFFAMFKLQFIYGGPWDAAVDEQAQATVVISETLSEQLFGIAENSVGKTLQIDQQFYTISGVVKDYKPSPFFYDLVSSHFKEAERVFLPFSLVPQNEPPIRGNISSWRDEKSASYTDLLESESLWILHWVELLDTQQEETYQNYLSAYIDEQKKYGRFSKSTAKSALRDINNWIRYNRVISEDDRILVGLGFLFLLACLVNTIGLLLAKLQRSASQASIRRALGASQRDLSYQYCVEIILIGIAGGLLGLMLTSLGLAGVRSIFHHYDDIARLDSEMVILTQVFAIVSALGVGLLPIINAARTAPSVYLKAQ